MKKFKAHFSYRTYVGTDGIFKYIACCDIEEAEKIAEAMAAQYGWKLEKVYSKG